MRPDVRSGSKGDLTAPKPKAKGPGWQSRIDADLRRINKIK
jgi:hypothetical protein